MYYPCSENKGADQLCGYRKADLRLCFHIYRLVVFLVAAHFSISYSSCICYVNRLLNLIKVNIDSPYGLILSV